MSMPWACDVCCCCIIAVRTAVRLCGELPRGFVSHGILDSNTPFHECSGFSPFEAVNCRLEMKKIPKIPKVGQGSCPSSRVVAPYLRFVPPLVHQP